MCTDFSGFTLPAWQEVHDDVARDPMRAVAEAEAIRTAAAGQMGQPEQHYHAFGDAEQQHLDPADGSAGLVHAQPGGTGQVGQFTTALQIQQWTQGGGHYQHADHGQQHGQEAMGSGAGAGMFF